MVNDCEQVRRRLMSIVDFFKESEKPKTLLPRWIGDYDGKIIEFQIDNTAFHLVFTKEDVRFEEGSYPSPDVIVVSNANLILNSLSGKTRLSSSTIKEGKLMVWGNFHDLISFIKLASS